MQTHEERIRQRAHEIWEAEGRPEGREYSRWLRARNDIAEADAAFMVEDGSAGRRQDGLLTNGADWLDWSVPTVITGLRASLA